MLYFKPLKERESVWALFLLLNNREIDMERSFTKTEYFPSVNVTIEKLCTEGVGVNVAKEKSNLEYCKKVKIFTDEQAFYLFGAAKKYTLYRKDGEEFNFPSIEVIKSELYVSEDGEEIISDKECMEKIATDDLFLYLKEYLLTHCTKYGDYELLFEKSTFRMKYKGTELLKITNVDVSISYPFVIYFFLRINKKDKYIQTSFKDERVEKV